MHQFSEAMMVGYFHAVIQGRQADEPSTKHIIVTCDNSELSNVSPAVSG